MKNLSMLIALSFIVLFAACKKDEDEPTTPTTPTYSIKWKMNGTEYKATTWSVQDDASTTSIAASINYNSQMSALGLYMKSSAVGTYTGTTTSNATMLFTSSGSTESYYSETSTPVTIKVTENSGTEFKGEFNVKLFNSSDSTKTLNVTEGTFYVKLPGK